MTTPVEIVTAAAAAFVGAMGTEAWNGVREGCARYFRRHGTSEEQAALVRLDGFERDLSATPEAERPGVVQVYVRSVVRDLAPVVARGGDAETDLRELLARIVEDSRAAGSGAVFNSNLTFHHIKPQGDFNFGGRDNNVSGRP